jgi:hypothetical protein
MVRISRRRFMQTAAVTAGVTLGAPSVHTQQGRQQLRFVAHADLRVLDPIWTTAYITRNHGYLVYDTLFGTDENLQIKPQMVDRTAGIAGRHEIHVHAARRPTMARRAAGCVGRLCGIAQAVGTKRPLRPVAAGAYGKDYAC